MANLSIKKVLKKTKALVLAAAITFGTVTVATKPIDVNAAFEAKHYDIREDGGSWDGTNYKLDGEVVRDAFFCDGTYTYFLQADGTPMTDRLTYHPDGVHVIYFDDKGHEVFSNFSHVKKSISGDAVDDLCFFDVYGYMYVNFLTFNQDGSALYYANPYGVMECNGWFQFAEDAGYVAEAFGITEGTWGYAYSNGKVDPKSIGDESVKKSFVPSSDGNVSEKTDSPDISNEIKTEPSFDTAWKKAYNDKLTYLEANKESFDKGGYPAPVYSYFIYDIDNDITPELFVRFGTCEADFFLKAYKYQDSKVIEIGKTFCGHTSFYAIPDKGMISYWAHMGYSSVSKTVITESGFESTFLGEEDINNQPEVDYKDASDYISGAEYLNEYKLQTRLPISGYDVHIITSTGEDEETVKRKLADTVIDNGKVHFIKADYYDGEFDNGFVKINDLGKKGILSSYSSYILKDYVWEDVNDDGQVECVLIYKEDGTDSNTCNLVILSLQDDVVYAYELIYITDDFKIANTIITYENGKIGKRITFYKNDAYADYIY
ncbi:MAG: hypothetical protein IJ141_04850 [Lachnospiraceae bacterium]|nr:hypothetical protein [Lachnospiraceae bacterium]